MKQTFSTLCGLAALCIAATASSQDKVVNVYNWSDYIDTAILEEFTAETGIKVVYDVFDSNEVLEAKLLAGSTGYDIVVPTGGFLARQIEAGVFQKLDLEQLPNRANMWDVINERLKTYREDINEYAINYMWGTTGVGYNVDKIKERLGEIPTNTWQLVFDPSIARKLADCGIHWIDAPDEIIPTALNYIGEDPNATDPRIVKKSQAVLAAVRPYVQKYHSSEYVSALANGDICLAVGWSGDVLQARDRAIEADNGVTIEYVIPKEGAMLWFDQMAIPKDAPNAKNAHLFLDYVMRPEVIAKASNYVFYANGNKSSQKLLDAEVLEDPAIYPVDSTVQNLFVKKPYGPRIQRIVTRLWTAVKTGN